MVQNRPITSPQGIAWYRRLSAGGAALVIVEATGVPAFGEDLTGQALTALVETIHAAGAAAAIQLFPIRFGQAASPDDLSIQDIERMIAQYATAATICRDAGFDGVEPHGAHGFLLNQFFMPDRNHRQDDYGGSLAGRSRLAERIVRAIRDAIGDALVILYRHTPRGEAYTIKESLGLARRLVDAGVDVMDISPAMADEPADMAAPFARGLDVPVIAVNQMEDPDVAAAAIRDGRCDLVALGRQLIADAEWPAKVTEERFDKILWCSKCDRGCHENLAAGKPVVCAQWPEGYAIS